MNITSRTNKYNILGSLVDSKGKKKYSINNSTKSVFNVSKMNQRKTIVAEQCTYKINNLANIDNINLTTSLTNIMNKNYNKKQNLLSLSNLINLNNNFESGKDSLLNKSKRKIKSFEKRKISSNIMEKTSIFPFYVEKPSFYNEMTTENKIDYLIDMRTRSNSKYYTRIKKQIESLSDDLKDGIIPTKKTINRLLVLYPKKEYFSINRLSAPDFAVQNEKKTDIFNKYTKLRFSKKDNHNHFSTNTDENVFSINDLKLIIDNFRKYRKKY